jgi:hypothetical protein
MPKDVVDNKEQASLTRHCTSLNLSITMCYGAFYNIGKEIQPRWNRMNDYFRKELQL